ncbi:hypothetical protein Glove_99g309 [Diversispora epigaea]|uniref:Uncharacterized protein n=1 Tax=Diversispora epigaea TaxID=1348612 RepID=A0A397J7R3_9GLOM|nr:hypothetical protein Glove_99g309 [Diversispora epigaea]
MVNPLEKLDIYNEMDLELMDVIIEYATEIGGLKRLGIVDGWRDDDLFEQVKDVIEIIGKATDKIASSYQ